MKILDLLGRIDYFSCMANKRTYMNPQSGTGLFDLFHISLVRHTSLYPTGDFLIIAELSGIVAKRRVLLVPLFLYSADSGEKSVPTNAYGVSPRSALFLFVRDTSIQFSGDCERSAELSKGARRNHAKHQLTS